MIKIELKDVIREVPDFPKKGILFYDITTMLKDHDALKLSIDSMYELIKNKKIDKVAGIESRGFIFGVPLALKLGCGFIPIRKPNKLPAKKIYEIYNLEYGSNKVEIHEDAIKKGENVLIVDDLLATGGTMSAATSLVLRLGGKVSAIIFLIELESLKGRDRLKNYDVYSVLKYD